MSKKTKSAIIPTPTPAVELSESHAHITAFAKAAAAFQTAHGSFKSKTVSTVNALRGEGYSDGQIKAALREVITKLGASPQMLNLVFRTPADKGGCGMAAERVKEKAPKSPKATAPVAGRAATGGAALNLKDSKAVYAALLVIVDGDNLAVAKWSEEIYALALEGASKLGKPAPAPAAPAK